MNILLLKLGDAIKGEVTLDGYAGQIECLSFAHGISQTIVHGLIGRTGTTGRPHHQDFTVAKYLDLASTGILAACDRGAVLPQVAFTAGRVESGKVNPFWTVTTKNVIITSVSMGGGGGDKPTENITLNYTAITWLYTPQRDPSEPPATGSASWDLTTNAEIP